MVTAVGVLLRGIHQPQGQIFVQNFRVLLSEDIDMYLEVSLCAAKDFLQMSRHVDVMRRETSAIRTVCIQEVGAYFCGNKDRFSYKRRGCFFARAYDMPLVTCYYLKSDYCTKCSWFVLNS